MQPLILDDGTVYGVVGVELLTSYLTTQLPSNELQNTDHGTYLLATTDADLKRDDVINVRTAFLTGEDADKNMPQTLTLYRDEMDWMFWLDGEEQYATLQQLGLYSRNAPFSGEAWLLIGTVAKNDLYRFSHSVRNLLVMAALLAAVVGLVCSVVVARQLAKPVAQLSKELARAKNDHVSVPEFSRTGIRELDQFASAIVQLSRENEEATALERRRIEHERDYDILTGLYNRQAFQRVCENLFAKPETLGHAALLMTDLDNLKTINDTYGHDWGDQYLRQTAAAWRPVPRRAPSLPASRAMSSCCCSTVTTAGRPCGKSWKSCARPCRTALPSCPAAASCTSASRAAWPGTRRTARISIP